MNLIAAMHVCVEGFCEPYGCAVMAAMTLVSADEWVSS